MVKEINDFRAGRPIAIPVYNRFNTTSLKEIKLKWKYKGKETLARIHNIEPREKGVIQLPPAYWQPGQIINIKFLQNDTCLVDEYNLRLGKREMRLLTPQTGNLEIVELAGKILQITGERFKALFDEKTGLLENVVSDNDTIIKSGPWLHLRYPSMNSWSVVPITETDPGLKIKRVDHELKDGILIIQVSGTVETLEFDYQMKIDAKGAIIIDYDIYGADKIGKAEELGLEFMTGNTFDTLGWDRDSYWNYYPPDHIGISEGKVSLKEINRNRYRQKPGQVWEYDNNSFYYNGLSGSNDLSYIAGSMKENIYSYILSRSGKPAITVSSKADKACRIARREGGYAMYINKFWDYLGINWGNYFKNQPTPGQISDTVYLKIN